MLARFDGATTAKVKVAERGSPSTDDLDRVAAVRDMLGPPGRIRVDANGGWAVPDATEALRRLAAYGLEYAEQPCAEVSELRELRLALARYGATCRSRPTSPSARRRTHCWWHARRPRTSSSSRWRRSAGCAERSRWSAECGLPAVVSSALDTSVGMAAGAALAGALPELPFACGLGTVALLGGDVIAHPWCPRGCCRSAGCTRTRAARALGCAG